MFRKATFGFLFLAMAISSNLASADNDPTLQQVYQAAQAGRLDVAQSMMDKVLKDHPNSAKAHFVEAEISAKQGLIQKAEAELNYAERLEPGLPFAKPQAVQDLKNRIGIAHPVSQPIASGFQPATSNGFPWGILFLGLGAIAVIFLVIRKMNSRNPSVFPANSPAGTQNTAAYPAQSYGSGGIGPMTPAGGGIGSGIMEGLATGAAVGVGMVAGEALAHHFMDGNHGSSQTPAPLADSWGSSSNDMGGTDFGIADSPSWDDGSSIAGNIDTGGDWG